jgi:intracellular protein transport protein USO1
MTSGKQYKAVRSKYHSARIFKRLTLPETVLLLVSLTPASPELQKIVAYEGAFNRIFAIIESEGSLNRGGVVVQACLSLFANLLRLNVSNQSDFRETGCIPKAANLLRMVVKDESEGSENQPLFVSPQKEKNIWGFLSVLRLFLQGSSAGTQMNQVAFLQHGVTFAVLDLGFSVSLAPHVRSEVSN